MLKLASLAGHWARPPSSGGGGGSTALTYVWSTNFGSVSTEKYSHDSGVLSWSSALSASLTDYGTTPPAVAVGNTSFALLKSSNVLGSASSSTKYTYADESSVAFGTYTTHRRADCGVQSSTTGYYMGGRNGSNVTASTEVQKILFSGGSITAGAALGTGRANAAAAGTSSVAICAGGANSMTTFVAIATSEKYTYGSDTRAAGTALAGGRALFGATGDATFGIFAGGNQKADGSATRISSNDKYTYATDAHTVATSLGTARHGHAAGGDNTFGLFIGGDTASSTADASVEKYTFASDAVAAATALATGRANAAAKCTQPGGL